MKRIALSLAAAIAAFGIGACEQRSAEDLPDHYKHKGGHGKAASGHEPAPAHGEKEKPHAGDHKG